MNGDGWPPNFPPVLRFVDKDFKNDGDAPLELLKKEPDYDAGKYHGDKEAAARLIEKYLTRDENKKPLLRFKANYQDALIVPVRSEENKSNNRIPTVLAEYLAQKTGIEIDKSIVLTNKTGRAGKGGWHKFAFRPKFDGKVEPGRRYILFDDVFAYGGTLNELRLFIEKKGGIVPQMAALTLGRHNTTIALQPETHALLLHKFGEKMLHSFLKDKEINLYEGNYKNLTEPEARLIGNFQNLYERGSARLDTARNNIIQARHIGIAQICQKETRPCNPASLNRPDSPPKPSRGFRR